MTLVELLVVIGIMTIALSLVAGAYRSFGSNVEMGNSIQQVTSTLDLARQLATSKNQYAQVRFLSPQGGDFRAGQYTAMAVYLSESPLYGVANAEKVVQASKTIQLPTAMVVVNDSTYSPLLGLLYDDQVVDRKGSNTVGETTYDSVAFYFKPDGSMDVNYPSPLSFTITPFAKFEAEGKKPHANYAVVTLDRVNGRFEAIRP